MKVREPRTFDRTPNWTTLCHTVIWGVQYGKIRVIRKLRILRSYSTMVFYQRGLTEPKKSYFRVVWSCCNKQIWLQKKSSEKMKCVVMWLNMCCFPIERHQIRVWAVKVSFDPRQFAHSVTYMDISTSSCSLQYQLSFKARMVSVGWVCSEWQNSKCKKGTFSGISSVFYSNFGSADFWPKMDPIRPKITHKVSNSRTIYYMT